MKTCVVLDLETTGLRPKTDRILEIGALKIVDGCTADSYHVLVNPQMQIPLSDTGADGYYAGDGGRGRRVRGCA